MKSLRGRGVEPIRLCHLVELFRQSVHINLSAPIGVDLDFSCLLPLASRLSLWLLVAIVVSTVVG